MDLIDIQQLAPFNDGIKYLLAVIDTFTCRNTQQAWSKCTTFFITFAWSGKSV